MNIIDVIIVLIIAMIGITGAKNGVIKEGISFIGTLVIFIISYALKGLIGNILCIMLPFFKYSGNIEGLVTLNILTYQLVGFFIIFSVLSLVYAIVMHLGKFVQKLIDATVILTLPSAILGGIIGLVRGFLVMTIVLVVLSFPLRGVDIYEQSKLKDKILLETPIISSVTKPIALSVMEVGEVTEGLVKGNYDKNEANLKLLDTMLNLKVTDINTVETLVKFRKLKTVNNIDSVLDKYR